MWHFNKFFVLGLLKKYQLLATINFLSFCRLQASSKLFVNRSRNIKINISLLFKAVNLVYSFWGFVSVCPKKTRKNFKTIFLYIN